MAEFTSAALQTVATNQNVLFTETPYCCCTNGNGNIIHREGSGLITLRGNTCGQCYAKYRVTFNSNIAVPDGGTAGEISIAIAINGEALQTSVATVTPTATEAFFNVSTFAEIDVPKGCCYQISVENISDQDIDVQNANILVQRIG